MAISITVGKARLFNFGAISGGLPDLITPAAVGSGNPTKIRVTLDPSNLRRFAVVALAPNGVGTNANVTVNGHTTQMLVVALAPPPPPDGVTIDEAGASEEIDPPEWA